MAMFEAMQRSWRLTQEAWDVLRQDRELVLFPILSGICSLLASALFVVPILFVMPWGELQSGAGAGAFSHQLRTNMGQWHYVVLFLSYLVSYFIVVFFNCALVACVRIRFDGGDPSLNDGLSF